MAIGLAILIVAILFLIDRNHVWPQVWRGFKRTMKGAAVVAIVVAVLWGGYLAWSEHNYRIRVKAAEARAAGAEMKTAPNPYDATHRQPAVGEAIDCYEGYTLLPDEFAAFGGSIADCVPGQIPRPKAERKNLPPAELQHVERIEACQKQAATDPKDTPAQFQACSDIK